MFKRWTTLYFIQPEYFKLIDVYNGNVRGVQYVHLIGPNYGEIRNDKRFSRNQRQVQRRDWSSLINSAHKSLLRASRCNYRCFVTVSLTMREKETELIEDRRGLRKIRRSIILEKIRGIL